MKSVLELAPVLLLLGLGMGYSYRARKLTGAAVGVGGLLGVLIYLGVGYLGLGLLALFFALGTAASAWRVADKRRLGLAEENRGRRRAGQVLANAGVAGALGLLSWLWPTFAPLGALMLAGAFAAATADTLASELGNVYGSRYVNVLTLRPDTRGENGVVSMEGTLLGAAGSAVLAAAYCFVHGWGPWAGGLLLAGTAGNIADSLLGATLERRGALSNDAVNTLNTLVGALVAGACGLLF
ncbi:DUF92 domain-containing protein [Hymenobacter oligotrophus]|uniref:DUF92 domain-containing protein n=1 Tax=Hymenobacter oligotrophus TaxID=2319843 RepID=A0A3B7QW20_9BACT|nr:DUF92 domain-containing protein [Hymenobacter oligotrophus]AYA35994.1 DUF92 domain-containing protein [Hymenobacter oligotrophus]